MYPSVTIIRMQEEIYLGKIWLCVIPRRLWDLGRTGEKEKAVVTVTSSAKFRFYKSVFQNRASVRQSVSQTFPIPKRLDLSVGRSSVL